MDWSTKTVPKGGIFHPPKVKFNQETKQFLNLLIEESKMSMLQRKKLDYFLRNDEPFPTTRRSVRSSHVPEVTIRPGSSKRRSRETIINSGVYQRDKFVPLHPRVDREMEIQKLQDKMAFNNNLTKINAMEKIIEKNMKYELDDEEVAFNRMDELMKEIKDREQWLKEMEELGEGAKYRLLIKQQIQDKLREMNALKVSTPK